MAEQEFSKTVRNYVEKLFSPAEGWVVEARRDKQAGHEILIISRPRALAVGLVVNEDTLSKKIVEEAETLREMNGGYTAIVYTPTKARVEPEAQSYATRVGVRIVKLA